MYLFEQLSGAPIPIIDMDGGTSVHMSLVRHIQHALEERYDLSSQEALKLAKAVENSKSRCDRSGCYNTLQAEGLAAVIKESGVDCRSLDPDDVANFIILEADSYRHADSSREPSREYMDGSGSRKSMEQIGRRFGTRPKMKIEYPSSSNISKRQKLREKYPALDVDAISDGDLERATATMNRINGFSPNLARSVKKLEFTFIPDDDESTYDNIFVGGTTSDGQNVKMNRLYNNDLYTDEKDAVHEASHAYHNKLEDRQKSESLDAVHALYDHAYAKGYYRGKRTFPEESNRKFHIVRGPLRDVVEEHMLRRDAGMEYDARLLELYDNHEKLRKNSFYYKWHHVNQQYMPDCDFDDVEDAGKKMDASASALQHALTCQFGEEAKYAFHYEDFMNGGDRDEPILRGDLEKRIKGIKDEKKRRALERGIANLKKAKKAYSNELDGRHDSLRLGPAWKSTNPLGGEHGLARSYGADNFDEGVATMVDHIYEYGELPSTGDERHNNMMRNYVFLLFEEGFIPKSNKTYKDLFIA